MLKKFFLLLFLAISLSGTVNAASPGSWKTLSMSGFGVQQVLDTPQFVYYLTGDALYAYDKDNQETTYFTPGVKISDSGIAKIYYNKKEKYLLCAFTNGNIDLIYDSGRVVNMPEIRDANITSQKTINDVTFADGRAYVSASFGIVVIDDQKHVVLESGVYGRSVNTMIENGGKIAVFAGSNLYVADKNARHNTLDKFENWGNPGISNWLYLSPEEFLVIKNGAVQRAVLDPSAKQIKLVENIAPAAGATEFLQGKNNTYLKTNNGLVILDSTGKHVSTEAIDSKYLSQALSFWDSLASTWLGNADGIANYDLTEATPTVLSDKFMPESSQLFHNWRTFPSADGEEVYMYSVGQSFTYPYKSADSNRDLPLIIESYNWETGEILKHHPIVEKQVSSFLDKYQTRTGLNLVFGGTGSVVQDPEDPSILYVTNCFDGLFIVKDRKVVDNFNRDNSPLYKGWGTAVYSLAFDAHGNLWIGSWQENYPDYAGNASPVLRLPKASLDLVRKGQADKLHQKEASGKYTYWEHPQWPADPGWVGISLYFNRKGDKLLRIGGTFDNAPVVGYDTKGTSTLADDSYCVYNGFTDQDGSTMMPQQRACLALDKKYDHMWIGTSNGIFILKDTKQLGDGSSTNLNIVKPKVARNDGTAYADYLLSSDLVLAIAVDPQNRKWIGTSQSGLFLVSEDGTEILQEFNKDNSPLLTNQVTAVACNPNGNDVLIGTPEGWYVYSSDAAPGAESYSDVYAYPNPVRPDYSGLITITGLMDNSLVKIADTQGNVIWTGRSEGGLATWDGCDAAGNRVHSGVYMVYASQNATGSATGVVTKIVVIN